MQQYWQNLNDREKILVSLASVMLLIAMIYYILYQPLFGDIQRLQNEAREQKTLLTWMNHTYTDINTLKANQPDNPVYRNTSIVSIIDITLNQGNMQSIKKQVKQNNKNVIVTFNEIPAIELLNWLTELWQQHRIQIHKLSLFRKDSPGIIRAEIELSRTNAS